jgi:hypothetical protein
MRGINQVSALMLEQYILDELFEEERKFVEAALAWDEELAERYEELKKSNVQIKRQHPLGSLKRLAPFRNAPVLFTMPGKPLPEEPEPSDLNADKPHKKTFALGLCAAALVGCALAFAIMYLTGGGSNREDGANAATGAEIETSGGSLTGNTEKKDERQEADARPDWPEEEPSVIIPPEVTFIYENMYAKKQLTTVAIPDRINGIAKNAFADNPLLSITIGADVLVDTQAFPGNFASVYNNYGRAAGTYTRPNTNSTAWVRK